jgi:tRNA(Ile)-lysidine synthase
VRSWVQAQGARLQAFIVDHGLRATARDEAVTAAASLHSLGIATRILTLSDLAPGPGLSDRARSARYQALARACRDAGIIHLLLGHHAADQAETLLMRHLRGSGPAGLAGMAAVTETDALRLLRPVLTVPPGRLRATLRAAGLNWAEDPTNADTRFTRARLRTLRADAAGVGPATQALADAARRHGVYRAKADHESAAFLGAHAVIRPEGFLRIASDGPWPAAALAQALRMVTGAVYPPDPAASAQIAADPAGRIGRGLVLGGAQLLPAGRQGPGFLLCREAAAIASPVAAMPGTLWDGRFRLPAGESGWRHEVIGPLGADAARFRRVSDLPSAVLRTLPCFRDAAGRLLAVPHLAWSLDEKTRARALVFAPPVAASGAAFLPALSPDSAVVSQKHDGRGDPA